jgi:hypothetical protein
MGVAYDMFGNGRTALKVNVGKYLRGASVSNLAYNANPSLRIPFGTGLSTTGVCSFGALGFANPCVSRTWTDADGDIVPDCVLTNPLANGECGQIDNLLFGSNQLVGARFDERLFSGWGVRPSDWSFGASVQHQLFPRASVEVGYYRRTFTQFFTEGTVTDNLAVSPSDVRAYTLAVPNDPRLPNSGGTVGPLYNQNPNVFGQSNLLIRRTNDVGDDTRKFNGVDVNFNVRGAGGFTFTGGTSTGKVVSDWCEIREAVPETYMLNPYCRTESPWQTSFRSLATYQIPRIDVLASLAFRDTVNLNNETDQLLGSLEATHTMTAADQAAAAAQIGRPLTAAGALQVNLLAPGELYGPRVRSLDLSAKKIFRFGGQRLTVGADFYNLANNNVTIGFNQTFVPNTPGWQSPASYMNPRVVRLNAEFAW